MGKSSKEFPDGKMIYQGYMASGIPFLDNKPSYSYDEKSIKKGGSFTVIYLFDLTAYKNDSHQKQLQVYAVDENHVSMLTHQYKIKE